MYQQSYSGATCFCLYSKNITLWIGSYFYIKLGLGRQWFETSLFNILFAIALFFTHHLQAPPTWILEWRLGMKALVRVTIIQYVQACWVTLTKCARFILHLLLEKYAGGVIILFSIYVSALQFQNVYKAQPY